MLNRRQKSCIIFFVIGLVSGVGITVLVVSFGVITNFTKKKIDQVYREPIPHNFPAIDTVPSPIPLDSTQTDIIADMPTIQDTVREEKMNKDSLNPVAVDPASVAPVVKIDRKITEAILIVENIIADTLIEKPLTIKEMKVEQWENPTNFTGYKLSNDLLIIYGIDVNYINLQSVDGKLFLLFANKSVPLKKSDNFEHFMF